MRSTAGAIEDTQHAGGTLAIQRQFVVVSLWSILGLAIGLAVLLLVRRMSGAFQQPLSGMAIVALAVLAELTTASYRRLWAGHDCTNSQHWVLSTQYSVLSNLPLNFLLPSLVVLIGLISLTMPGTPLFGILLAWLIVITGEAVQWQFLLRPMWHHVQPRSVIPPHSDSPGEDETEPAETEIPPGLIQQVTRVLEDSRESIHAIVQAKVAANDRLAIIHLSFCPPLTERPELTAHALDMDEADVRITQAETFGARLEVRLPVVAPAERSFLIEVLGSAATAKSA